jgi:hypothetical protein
MNKRYKKVYGKNIDWENPADLNEKILWLEYHTDTTLWSDLADKYKVREYVEKCGLGHILVKLYGVWDNAEEIDFEKLPDSFVLKTNNGSGGVLLVTDKNKANLKNIRQKIKKTLKEPFGIISCEPHYPRMKPCVIAEELLPVDTSVSSSLIDYKMWYFNGKPYSCFTAANRNIERHTVDWNIYDIKDWQSHPEYMIEPYRNTFPVPKPGNLDELLRCASILSNRFKQVRIDMYDIHGKIYFGEMTFTSNAGIMNYFTPEYLKELGEQFEVK